MEKKFCYKELVACPIGTSITLYGKNKEYGKDFEFSKEDEDLFRCQEAQNLIYNYGFNSLQEAVTFGIAHSADDDKLRECRISSVEEYDYDDTSYKYVRTTTYDIESVKDKVKEFKKEVLK